MSVSAPSPSFLSGCRAQLTTALCAQNQHGDTVMINPPAMHMPVRDEARWNDLQIAGTVAHAVREDSVRALYKC